VCERARAARRGAYGGAAAHADGRERFRRSPARRRQGRGKGRRVIAKTTGLSPVMWLIAALLLVLTIVGALELSNDYASAVLMALLHVELPEEYATVALMALLQAPLYAIALWRVIARPATIGDRNRALISILIVGAVLRLVLIAAPPSSTDVHRYVWDGRVQAHGINPYRYIP